MVQTNIEYAAIRCFSISETWMDAVILLPFEFVNQAVRLIRNAVERSFDETDEHFYEWGYGDYICDSLKFFNVPFSIVYLDDFSNNDYLFEKYMTYIRESGCEFIMLDC